MESWRSVDFILIVSDEKLRQDIRQHTCLARTFLAILYGFYSKNHNEKTRIISSEAKDLRAVSLSIHNLRYGLLLSYHTYQHKSTPVYNSSLLLSNT